MSREKKYKVRWDPENKIVRIDFFGLLTREAALDYIKKVRKIYKEKTVSEGTGEYNALIDLRRSEKLPTELRKLIAKKTSDMNIHKVAYVSDDLVFKIIGKAISGFSGYRKTGFFSNKKEALGWLKEGVKNFNKKN